jgi:hypothetical protein
LVKLTQRLVKLTQELVKLTQELVKLTQELVKLTQELVKLTLERHRDGFQKDIQTHTNKGVINVIKQRLRM